MSATTRRTVAQEGPLDRDSFASLVVRTRLSPPIRPAGTVYRHRLDRYGEDFRRPALTVLKGPAGYGKSSLMGQWFEQLRRAGAAAGWLSLDPTPDDLMSFVRHLVTALQIARPDFGRQLDLLFGSAARPSTAGVTVTLTNNLAAVDEAIFLFIDDFHLATDPDVLALTKAMLERPPANLHFVIASRHALPFSLSRLRAKGAVAEIDSGLLRFDNQEAAEFLRSAGHGSLSLSEIDMLVSRTEGWAAGLQLAAILLAQNTDHETLFSLLEGRHCHLSEYLTDDVIDRLPGETADFLLKTSILSRLCAPLCDAVTGLDNARAHLGELERQSLFLSSLDSERVWYRYHHLFASVLYRRLLERAPELAPELHRRACEWFARHGFVDEAFAHALEAGETDRAAALLDDACDRMLYSGRLSTVLRWADRLPAAALRPYPRLRLQAAFSLILEWKFAAAARIIAEVERDLESGATNTRGDVREAIDIRHIVSHRKLMLCHFMDDTAETERIIDEAIAEFPDIDPYLRGNLETCMIYARRERYRLANIERMDVHARDYYERAGSLFVAVWHEAVLGPTYYLSGDVDMAERSLETSIRTAERIDGEISPLVAMPALLLADVRYERNDISRAAEFILRFGPEAEKQGFVDHLVSFYVVRARLAAMKGDEATQIEAAREGHVSATRHGFARLENFMLHEDMRRAVAAGDVDMVRRLLNALGERDLERALNPGAQTTTRDEPVAMAWSRGLCALGNHAEAARVLRRWIAFTSHRGALKSEVRLLVLLAGSLARDRREGEALRCLREAVKKAARPRFVRSFLDEGQPIEALLTKLFAGADEDLGPTTAFGLELMRLFAFEAGPSPDESTALASMDEASAPLEPLTARESEVIKLVAQGLSNRAIGARLGLTEGSVKWYLQGIFTKLGVRRRSMAMIKARKCGLA
jgi:LuxR family transcriptional regulator, maltose regulon positive regulatory protein